MPTAPPTVWAGVDVGKTHHWVEVVDATGATLLSRRVSNDQSEIDAVIADVVVLAEAVLWAVDIVGAPSALLLALLAAAQQQVRYASGRVVSVMSSAFTGEGKTDAKDAHVIAETARLRRDLSVVDQVTDLARNLAVLTAHRADLVADRVRGINRLRDLMTRVFPALEREFDYASCKGALVLVSGYATPDRLRRVGRARLAAWLRARHVRSYAQLADRAVTAAGTQRIVVPGQEITAAIVSELASSVLALDARITDVDAQIAATFELHPQSASIVSMPGFGPFLAASLLAAAGDLRAFPSAGHLAAAAGPERLRPTLGQPAQAPPLQPATAARVLPLGADRHDAARSQSGLLPQKARARPHPHPSRYRPRPPPHRRALGAAPRQPTLHRTATRPRRRGLTTSLRFPMPGDLTGVGLDRAGVDGDHVPDAPATVGGHLAARAADRTLTAQPVKHRGVEHLS